MGIVIALSWSNHWLSQRVCERLIEAAQLSLHRTISPSTLQYLSHSVNAEISISYQ